MNEEYLTGRDVLRWLANGADISEFEIEVFETRDSLNWQTMSEMHALVTFLSRAYKFRRKPRTITVTIKVPEPMREEPPEGTYYYPITSFGVATFSWLAEEKYRGSLKSGLAWDTKEKAQAAFDALSAALGVRE